MTIERRISASITLAHGLLIEDQDVTQFVQLKLARRLAEEILKRKDIFSREETYQGVTFSAEFYCLTGEQLNEIVQDAIQDITLSRIED